jgi:hypothetical protein
VSTPGVAATPACAKGTLTAHVWTSVPDQDGIPRYPTCPNNQASHRLAMTANSSTHTLRCILRHRIRSQQAWTGR